MLLKGLERNVPLGCWSRNASFSARVLAMTKTCEKVRTPGEMILPNSDFAA
jgi:hypothetical protein